MKKILFTPGPLTTSNFVKNAMMCDLGSRDSQFTDIVKNIRKNVLKIANVNSHEFTMIPIQGSGTFGVEATISSVSNNLLIITNGVYGKRMEDIAKIHNIKHKSLNYPDNEYPNNEEIDKILKNSDFTHVAVVHSETTTGIINNIEEIGEIVKNHKKSFIVDAMSSFGGTKINFKNIDYLISSSNKCLESVPGFSFVIAKNSSLENSKTIRRTLSLNLYEQNKYLNETDQFRFTPPVHSLLAFDQALREFENEGLENRIKRYQINKYIIDSGMTKNGFNRYLEDKGGHIISSYYHKNKNFSFEKFYNYLNEKGFVLYPGKNKYFRIGHIGNIYSGDSYNLISAVSKYSD